MPTPTTPVTEPASRAWTAPPPAAVAGNLWTAIEVAGVGELEPSATVSVIVTGEDPDGHLPLTLAALARQSYPAPLTEVVIARGARGEDDALRGAAGGLELKRAPGADAATAATGEILLFLPAGSLPERELAEAHARWHHAAADVVVAGPSRRASLEGVSTAEVSQGGGRVEPLVRDRIHDDDKDATALEHYLEETRDLTARHPDLFRVAARGSVSVRAETFAAAGGSSGVDDHRVARLDLAYRLDCLGCVFAPERAAVSYTPYPDPWPQVIESRGDGATPAGASGEDPRVASLLPVRGFRPRGAGRVFTRPAMVVNLPAADRPAADLLSTVDAVLRGHLSDLVVRVELPGDHPEGRLIDEACAADPRVAVTSPPAKQRSESPFEVTVPAGVQPDEGAFDAIHDLMAAERLGALHVAAPGRIADLPLVGPRLARTVTRPRLARAVARGPVVEAAATGPLARARRVATHEGRPVGEVLGRLFGERRVSGAEVGIRRQGEAAPESAGDGLGPASDLAHERAEHLRYRARAATSQARLDREAQRLHRERQRASHERTRADRLEARLARASPTFWVRWKAKRVGRRVAALPKRAWGRVERLREPLYRVKQSALGAVARRRG